ncbi:hypothetical protein A2870_00180 [Candidatus Curtissbacteria bacterium RIFCSPHIGHO2_01_FULL_41_11]|uniref:Uncharacterized protein n=1 Tax=Candidatus Curtissbacteria bacterium RIFCSPHIGHO2_01_FULL_41_11 TaxID=1797711 RepID=A0A1F5G3P9_9BACT|nr:MAG: hypothetical protein A2870_00180 [Candidatus Curtissbacteria bacterium RIFCSPHIGHO2_01_FULL_41_11]
MERERTQDPLIEDHSRPLDTFDYEFINPKNKGTEVSIKQGGIPVWEKTVRNRIPININIRIAGYLPIPFYRIRIGWAKKQAEKAAKSFHQ